MNRKIFFSLLVGVSVIAETAFAQISGGIDDAMMQGIKNAYKNTSADKAIRNALNANSIQKLAVSADQKDVIDGYFSDRVYSRGVTDQKASGRCWLFTGLNVFRAKVIDKYKLPEFE
ncbi:MAG: C1 family peptidase, partial [Coprobacter fastidiosus]